MSSRAEGHVISDAPSSPKSGPNLVPLRVSFRVLSGKQKKPTLSKQLILLKFLAIAPQYQRRVAKFLGLMRSLLLHLMRMSPIRRPVSASKNSVPGGTVSSDKSPFAGSEIRNPGRQNRRLELGFNPSASTCRLHAQERHEVVRLRSAR